VLIFLLKINIVIEYSKGGKNNHFEISFFVFKKRFRYEIKDKNEKIDRVDTYYQKIMQNIENSKSFYGKNQEIIKKIMNYLKCRICIEKLEFSAVIGTGNASYTAILTGIAWSVAGILVSILHSFTNVKDKRVEIKPDFTGKKFNLELYCIFKVRIVYIIVIGLMILKHLIKAKAGFLNIRRSITVYK
jgi:hypothetical protein